MSCVDENDPSDLESLIIPKKRTVTRPLGAALGGEQQPNLLWSSKSREPVPMLGYRKSLNQRLGRLFQIKKTRLLIPCSRNEKYRLEKNPLFYISCEGMHVSSPTVFL